MSDMFEGKLKQLKEQIKKEKFDAVLISSVSNISYLTGFTNFSKDEREAFLIIGDDFQYIITDARYSEAIKKDVPHFQLFERGYKTPVEDLFKTLKKDITSLGIEEDNLTVSEHRKIKKHFKKTKHFDVNSIRSIKNNEEIKKIETACKIGDRAFEYVLKKIKAGVTEKQIAQEIEKFIKENGAEISFPSIVAFGANSSVPHHQTGNDVLGPSTQLSLRSGREGLIILLDFGVKFENYCSDMTRTVFFGTPSKKQEDIYNAVLTAQQKAVDFLNLKIKSNKNVSAQQVDKAARDYIISKGYSSIPHSLGHGIGLQVHEHPNLSPKSKEVLKEGMVFSIEPGIYIKDFGSPRSTRVEAGGVRIEDLFVYEKGKLRQLTTSPKNLTTV